MFTRTSLEQLPGTSLEHTCLLFLFSQVISLQLCGADPRGVRVEWRDGGGWAHLVGVAELGRMLGSDPTMALSVLYGLDR